MDEAAKRYKEVESQLTVASCSALNFETMFNEEKSKRKALEAKMSDMAGTNEK